MNSVDYTTAQEIPGFASYLIDRDGGVFRHCNDGQVKLIKPHFIQGYRTVTIAHKQVRVHRLMLLTFAGPPPADMKASFIDGDKNNLVLSNLAWATQEQITAWQTDRGSHYFTIETAPKRVLDWDDVHVIRARLARGESQRAIANDYRVTRQAIGNILHNRSWRSEAA